MKVTKLKNKRIRIEKSNKNEDEDTFFNCFDIFDRLNISVLSTNGNYYADLGFYKINCLITELIFDNTIAEIKINNFRKTLYSILVDFVDNDKTYKNWEGKRYDDFNKL